MKSYDSRTYSINDFVEWDNARQLELNPRFQRRSVWSEKAKSYLIDTIVRGKPIPKVFIRQKINVTTKTSLREVVDGQQRLRTILSFIKDGFSISKTHNKEFGGLFYSQLPQEIQAGLLSYEVSVDILFNLPDAEVLDIFGRLNSYAVVLNEQEKLNAEHFGPFKVLSDEIARTYNEYWTSQKIFSSNQILRMYEVSLTADLIIAMVDGIRGKKQIGSYYARFERSFDYEEVVIEGRFQACISLIADLFPETLSGTMFRKQFLFYTLFTTIYHCLFGLPHLNMGRVVIETGSQVAATRNRLDRIDELFAIRDITELSETERQFLEDSRRATTDSSSRLRRTQFVINLLQA